MAWAKWSDTLRRCLMARAIKAESIWSELFGHTFWIQIFLVLIFDHTILVLVFEA